ncbi:ATP-binding protein [Thermoleptolyngbya sichuanensis A183]|uniref:ATP-binding protein n=1 Tax=Thermoleptolyngbya sichuanensis A183 TaxID=2737172 RepID=A0A6M8BBM8_9CYAN|nr:MULTISPECIES: ATP-binding protein [Thermoleptolyngbya]QKD80981.1 ATP-binding protein [Thermoleptolyngbya sichuanensis A183]
MDAQVLKQIHLLHQQAASLLVYPSVLRQEPGQALLRLLAALGRSPADRVDLLRAYGDWFYTLATRQQSWQSHLLDQILLDDNPFTQATQRTDLSDLPQPLVAAAAADLRSLQALYTTCTGDRLGQWLAIAAGLSLPPVSWGAADDPKASASPQTQTIRAQFQAAADWASLLPDLAQHYRSAGVGDYARYRAFRWQGGRLEGIPHPDPISLNALVGYERQKQQLLQNTEALLAGAPALNVLLYGSRGTGKSSLVKALLNQYGDRGLRLIEVSKAELANLPDILPLLRDVPQAFILFVDDLSFEEDDEAFKALKVVLEGSVVARSPNVVVYATSNRRHLIREFFGDRPRPSDADEIYSWDTVQEKLSFGDRFGLTLTFEPADQDTYLEIVRHLARQNDLPLDPKTLEFQALQWATQQNGRSGRTARQFVDWVRSTSLLSVETGSQKA